MITDEIRTKFRIILMKFSNPHSHNIIADIITNNPYCIIRDNDIYVRFYSELQKENILYVEEYKEPFWTITLVEDYKVELIYFNENGRFKYRGEYKTNHFWQYKIYEEVCEMRDNKKLPGLESGMWEYFILINILNHPIGLPNLIIPKES